MMKSPYGYDDEDEEDVDMPLSELNFYCKKYLVHHRKRLKE